MSILHATSWMCALCLHGSVKTSEDRSSVHNRDQPELASLIPGLPLVSFLRFSSTRFYFFMFLSAHPFLLPSTKTDSALENLRVYLCEKIIAERHFDHLRAKKILSREDTEEISCRTSSRKRAGKLLDYLQENPKGLDTLVESIRREKTQNFLIQKITDEVLKLRNIKLEHLKGLQCSSCEPFAAGATNNLSRSNSDESNLSDKQRVSTAMRHPEGESSTAPFFSTESSLNLPVLEVGRTEHGSFSSGTLPRPGDPGAPPLPPDLRLEGGTCGNSSEMFLPLRSRALSRQ